MNEILITGTFADASPQDPTGLQIFNPGSFPDLHPSSTVLQSRHNWDPRGSSPHHHSPAIVLLSSSLGMPEAREQQGKAWNPTAHPCSHHPGLDHLPCPGCFKTIGHDAGFVHRSRPYPGSGREQHCSSRSRVGSGRYVHVKSSDFLHYHPSSNGKVSTASSSSSSSRTCTAVTVRPEHAILPMQVIAQRNQGCRTSWCQWLKDFYQL